ncbi:hypothetical protein WISP_123536 [Willisornis vidua]|uniref:Uncharacterized protein n=1 Tax=Willisornis vidua TaxID=1566151 RepID=A0ABQ9CRQ1_9PASS|nr:hypothetical protein WISP_123536 [Willisornis vidua]
MSSHPFCEELLPNVQPEPPPVQLKIIEFMNSLKTGEIESAEHGGLTDKEVEIPWYQESLEDEVFESSPVEQALGVLVAEKLDHDPLHGHAAQRGNHILSCIKSSVASKARKVIFYSTVTRSHLEHCIQIWDPHQRKNINLL